MVPSLAVVSVLLGLDDAVLGGDLAEALERQGHRVTWVGAAEVGPDTTLAPRDGTPTVIVVDGDAEGVDVAALAAAWRRYDPPPAFVVLCGTPVSRLSADRARALVVSKPVDTRTLLAAVVRAGSAPRPAGPPTAEAALRVLGIAPGGLPDDEAATIVAGARHVDAAVVREALRPLVYGYVTRRPLLDRLLSRRALTEREAAFAVELDGTATVKRLVDSGALEPVGAARLIWGLVSGGAASITAEPPDDADHPRARFLARARDHLRARRARLQGATAYEVLEIDADASTAEVERAVQLLASRFAPDLLGALDLGDLEGLVRPLWNQILQARALLVDPRARQAYEDQLLRLQPDADEQRQRRKQDRLSAEEAFVRGQRALAAGDPFRALSELATAARRLPDEPDYEVYAIWARVVADEARGVPRAEAALRERSAAERALFGRRPRPRACFALGLLAEAAGDLEAAREHFNEALLCDARLAPARAALERLSRT